MAYRDNPQPTAWPRLFNLILGIWLFISAFVWPHSPSSQTNTGIVGILIAATTIWTLYTPAARFVNTVLAVWLLASTWLIYHVSVGTLWNNLIVAIIVLVASLIPNGAGMTTGRPHRAAHA